MRLLVTREDYFEAAMAILGDEGEGRLKIGALCDRLGVTTGSFYGYFKGFDGFVEDFLAYWEAAQTDRIVQLSNAPEDPVDRIRVMKDLVSGLPHAAEAAIRSWAHTDASVAEAQKRVDRRRVEGLAGVLLPATGSRSEARKLAIMGITLLVGLQQWRSPVTKRDFNLIFNEYERMILSRAVENVQAS